ncbi:MAG: hypothetical protein ACI4S3_10705 [Candidatus Gastranaerophilaceae bacterium]
MYNKNDILLKLNTENYYIDRRTLTTFIEQWKIDAVYEDESTKEEYYDDFAIERIKKGINLKAQGFSDEQIIHKLNKNIETNNESTRIEKNDNSKAELVSAEETDMVKTPDMQSELRNLTLDVSTQTLQMLAESVAKKITDDIKNSDMAQKLIEAGGYKRDNELLSAQIQELIEHNKKLAERIEQLEKKESFFDKLINIFKQ